MDNNVFQAYSKDEIHFERPKLDAVEPGTNIVLKMHGRNSNTVWLAHEEPDPEGGTLTTRHLECEDKDPFGNLDAPDGSLQVEALDHAWNPIPPYTKGNRLPVCGDKTLLPVQWQGAEDFSSLARKPFRFRFHLRIGSL